MEERRKEISDKLIQYVDGCNAEFNRDLTIRINDQKDWLLAQSLLCFLNSGTEQTKAIAVCISNGYATAARTCLRGLLEITLDVRLMLDHGNPHENAARFLTLSALELKKTLQENKSVDLLDTRLKEYKDLFPIVFSEIESNFLSRKRIKHWSGLSYRERLSSINGATFDGLDTVYSILSWDTHSRMAVHNSKFEIKNQNIIVKSLDDDNLNSFENIIDCAGMVFHSLSNAVFYCPIVIEKSTGKNLVRPQ